MHFTVYKITNKTNQKFYIGAHKTSNLNDDYMGSGKLISQAIKKYGLENFEKEILYVFESEHEMFAKEKELITEMKPPYNLHEGGNGGFEYINKIGKNNSTKDHKKIALKISDKMRGRKNPNNSERIKKAHLEGKFKYNNFLGLKHTNETIQKMSNSKKGKGLGESNSQYGKIWITNGSNNKKIKSTDFIPNNWYKGRTF